MDTFNLRSPIELQRQLYWNSSSTTNSLYHWTVKLNLLLKKWKVTSARTSLHQNFNKLLWTLIHVLVTRTINFCSVVCIGFYDSSHLNGNATYILEIKLNHIQQINQEHHTASTMCIQLWKCAFSRTEDNSCELQLYSYLCDFASN